MKYTLHIILLFITLQSIAQEKQAKKYTTFKPIDKELVFVDEFDEEENGWILDVACEENSNPIDARAGVINYEHGELHYKKVDTTTYSKYIHKVEIDYSRNFEVEVSVHFPDYHIWIGAPAKDSMEYEGALIGIGADVVNKTKGLYSEFHKYGYSLLSHCDGSSDHEGCTKKWCRQNKKPYNKHGYNLYTIRKVGSNVYFFRNGKYIKKKKYQPLTGNYIALGGLFVNNVVYDYIKVSYLPAL